MELLWQNLDGFTKGSNIACTDYHQIRKLLMESMGLSEDIPKEPSVVETGHYDELPDRLSEMLEEILQVYLKK